MSTATRTRSPGVTLLGWLMLAGGAILTPVSVLALLMVLAKSPGSSSGGPLEALLVLAGPPATAVAGLGLLRRWRWAHTYAVVSLGVFILASLARAFSGPVPTSIRTLASGERIIEGYKAPSVPVGRTLAAAAVLGLLLTRRVRTEFFPDGSPTRPAAAPPPVQEPSRGPGDPPASDAAAAARGWRVGHRGRDGMFYEEWHAGGWRRIEIPGEMLTGRAHHAVYLPSPGAWRVFPEWARGRRDEIVARIRSEFRAPDYVYEGEAEGGGDPSPAGPVPAPAAVPVRTPGAGSHGAGPSGAPERVNAGSLAVVLALAVFGAGMGWMAVRGVARGEILLPVKRFGGRRVVVRAEQPALFWVSIGIHAALGAGGFAGAAWIGRELLRARRPGGR